MAMNELVLAKNLTKKYSDKIALQHFDISIPKGSIYGLLGPNGAGKTTFIRMLNQITQPDQGEIWLENEKLQQKHIAEIGYMPEERGLYKNMAIGEQCMYLAKMKGLSSKEAKERLDFWFEKLQIEKWWKKKLSELSKGMAQKIQFVVTVLHNPKLLIFDEPFSGFDPLNANLIRDEILELKKQGKTIIFSTHRMESVEEMCDYVALINQSQKVLDGDISTIRNKFKENKYEVEIEYFNKNALTQFPDIKIINQTENIIRFHTKIEDKNINHAVQQFLQSGKLIAFKEVIPTMNEVFIKVVNESSTNIQ